MCLLLSQEQEFWDPAFGNIATVLCLQTACSESEPPATFFLMSPLS